MLWSLKEIRTCLPEAQQVATVIGAITDTAMQRIGIDQGIDYPEHRDRIRAFQIEPNIWVVFILPIE